MMIKTETLDASIGRRVIAARKASECSEMEAAACLNLAEAESVATATVVHHRAFDEAFRGSLVRPKDMVWSLTHNFFV